jgi:hypothetical protein
MFTVSVTVRDDDGAADTKKVLVIAFDPDAGFATENGWIDSPAGAYVPDPAVADRAHVNSNVKYLNSTVVPEGHAAFRLDGTSLDLSADALEWLVVTPDGKVATKGTGTSGTTRVRFVIYGTDGCATNQTQGCQPGPDRIRARLAADLRPHPRQHAAVRQPPRRRLRPRPVRPAGTRWRQHPDPHPLVTGEPPNDL